MIDVNTSFNDTWEQADEYIEEYTQGKITPRLHWLGDGKTSQLIVDKIKEIYQCS